MISNNKSNLDEHFTYIKKQTPEGCINLTVQIAQLIVLYVAILLHKS